MNFKAHFVFAVAKGVGSFPSFFSLDDFPSPPLNCLNSCVHFHLFDLCIDTAATIYSFRWWWVDIFCLKKIKARDFSLARAVALTAKTP